MTGLLIIVLILALVTGSIGDAIEIVLGIGFAFLMIALVAGFTLALVYG